MDNPRYLGLYVHVPFCSSRCGYCSFTSDVYTSETLNQYLAFLKRDAKFAAGEIRPDSLIDTVYFGGGTPSVLTDGEIVKLIGSVTEAFKVKNDAEISFEANPESLTTSKLKLLRQLEINRLSIGIQSFDEDILGFLGREHSSGSAVKAVESAKNAGFANLSIDLIYGVPGQSLKKSQTDVECVLRLEPNHISTYCLSLDPGVPLYGKVIKGWPDEELQAEMYYSTREILVNAGYIHYEISNFAHPGYECRHNLKYWHDHEYLGLGAAAAFHWKEGRYKNPDDLYEYFSRINGCSWPLVKPEPTDAEREMRTAVILGLRLLPGISLSDFEKRFGVDLLDYYGDILGKLLEDELLIFENDNLRLSSSALFISDEIFSLLI